MRCPQCGSESKQPVKETRTEPGGKIRRRRRCPDCDHLFTTVEQLSEGGLRVRKSDGRVVEFSRASIRHNVSKAAVRELESEQLTELIDGVMADIYPQAKNGPVPTSEIGSAVLARLRQLDPATHIRFALVHAGRQDRSDERVGWHGVNDVRRWLIQEYPGLEYYRPPGGLAKVVKRDGQRKDFDRQKLERSIGVASKGRGNPEEVWELATEVAEDVERALGGQPIVTTGQIAAEILRSLRHRDHVAYLRFASTAKGFAFAEDYEAEAVALRDGRGLPPASSG